MEKSEKVCGPRKTSHVYSREELMAIILSSLSSSSFDEKQKAKEKAKYQKMTKKELCQTLNIPWKSVMEMKQSKKEKDIITKDKSCTSRRSKKYPHRYTRQELIELIRRKRPSFSRSTLMTSSFATLCSLAKLPFIPIISSSKITTPVSKPKSVLKTIDQLSVSRPSSTLIKNCRFRGLKQLLPHQKKVVDYLQDHRGVIAVHSVGSGKTLTAVVASQCYLDQHPDHKVLVITPASLIANFQKELDAFGPNLLHRNRYAIQSFEKFLMDASKGVHHSEDCRHTMVIIDEGHNLRTLPKQVKKKSGATEEKGKKTKAVLSCTDFADRVLILTATPLVNSILDLVPLVNMIREDPTPGNIFAPTTLKMMSRLIDNSQIWNTYFKNKFHFFTPETDTKRTIYPHVEYHNEYLKMSPAYYQKYQEIEENTLSEHSISVFGETKLKPFFNGIRRAVNTLDADPMEMSHSPKIKWIHDFLIRHQETFPKTLIFSQFLDMGSKAILQRIPPAWRARSAFIDGTVSRKKRAEIVEKFNTNEISLLFISKAGGEGLDLKGTKNVIIVETTWNFSSEKQAIGRAVRYLSHAHLPFSERIVNVYRLLLVKPNDSSHIDEIITSRDVFSPGGELVAADLMVHIYQLRKEDINRPFLHRLERNSIH